MAKGPRGEKRLPDLKGMSVMLAKIAIDFKWGEMVHRAANARWD